jgi:hypothetical protein
VSRPVSNTCEPSDRGPEPCITGVGAVVFLSQGGGVVRAGQACSLLPSVTFDCYNLCRRMFEWAGKYLQRAGSRVTTIL